LQFNNDMSAIEELDEKLFNFDLALQKGLTLIDLGMPVEESFADANLILNEMTKIFSSIDEVTIKLVAIEKIREAVNEFDDKLRQIV
jgi:hypothetical protein